MSAPTAPVTVSTEIPSRLDRLPWSPFHVRLVVALGACWVLDGFESWIASSLGDVLAQRHALGMTPALVGPLASAYLVGQVVGALLFGHLADRWGRRRLFFGTLTLYLAGSVLTATVAGSGSGALSVLFGVRFLAGMGIGGEYAAINSMIDELVPSTYRGRADVIVNGTYWMGAAVAGALQLPLLSGAIDPDWDWRLVMLVGPTTAAAVWYVRRRGVARKIPESPRWQLLHGQQQQAEASIDRIEAEIEAAGGAVIPPGPADTVRLSPRESTGYGTLVGVLFRTYPKRAVLSIVLMVAQSLVYNALFFSYASILRVFFAVPANHVGLYFIPFAIGNLLGPILLGPLFDRVGRRRMLARTYGLSAILLLGSVFPFRAGVLTATTQTMIWFVVFFFVSAGASAAYLTISEVFPLEVRGKAIAAFFAIIQFIGAFAPSVFSGLIDPEHPNLDALAVGYVVGAVLMGVAGVVAQLFAVDAENRSLESVAPPLALVVDPGPTVDDPRPEREDS